MARAREYLKRKTKQKYTWRRDFYRESRYTYRYPFCPGQVFIKKRLETVLKNTLLSSSPDVVKLRSQFAVLIAPTSEREDGRDRTRRKLQSGHGALFMVGGFALSSLGDETPKTAGVSA